MQPIYTNGRYKVIPLVVAYVVVRKDGIQVFRRDSVEDAIEDVDMLASEDSCQAA